MRFSKRLSFVFVPMALMIAAGELQGNAQGAASADPQVTVSYSAVPASSTNLPSEKNMTPTGSSIAGGVRYQKSASRWKGYELNYGWSNPTLRRSDSPNAYSQIQTWMHELSAAYVAKGPRLPFGVKSFMEAGVGAFIFAPMNGESQLVQHITTNWGKPVAPYDVVSHEGGLRTQVRAMSFLGTSLSYELNKYFGARADYRLSEYMSPTFKLGTTFGAQRLVLAQQRSAGVYLKF